MRNSRRNNGPKHLGFLVVMCYCLPWATQVQGNIYFMRFHVQYSKEACLRSSEITQDFLLFLEKNRYEYTWPFSKRTPLSHKEFLAQIEKDEVKFLPKEKISKLTKALAKHDSEIAKGWNLIQQQNPAFKNNLEANVFLTFYGPHGYFEVPDKIYINIAMGNHLFWLETILHEAIHLLTQNHESSEHEVEESQVDDLFITAFGNLFPNYQKQQFSKG